MSNWKRTALALAGLWLGLPILYGILRSIVALLFGGMTWGRNMDLFLKANITSGGGLLWVLLAIGAIGSIAIYQFIYDGEERVTFGATVLFSAVAIVAFGYLVKVVWDNDKDQARYYNDAITFVVPDTDNPPSSVRLLLNDARKGGGDECDLIGSADVPSCIVQGELAEDGWDPRIGSLDGAKTALRRSSGDTQRVSLNGAMMAYLNGGNSNSETPRWSGVLDGSGKQQSIGGIAEWTGTGTPKQCLFEGDFELDRAFDGERGNNLRNLLAETYPNMRWNESDVWGFCDGDEPIVVIPMIKPIIYKDRTVNTAGGIVTVRGENGKTKLEHISNVKPGEFPGPVYPASLVVQQREELKWAAGRKNFNPDRGNFGFDPASSKAQAGNVSEYLLRNAKTGRLEWVTPLTLRGSSSELFVVYAITPADVIDDGQLNRLTMYVLAKDDPRAINIDNLEADARNYLATNAGTFISNGGKLIEFTPVDGDIWRAFGELNGRVVYRLDISANAEIEPKLVNIGAGANKPDDKGDGDGKPSNSECGNALNELTPAQLGECLTVITDELVNRQAPAGTNGS